MWSSPDGMACSIGGLWAALRSRGVVFNDVRDFTMLAPNPAGFLLGYGQPDADAIAGRARGLYQTDGTSAASNTMSTSCLPGN